MSYHPHSSPFISLHLRSSHQVSFEYDESSLGGTKNFDMTITPDWKLAPGLRTMLGVDASREPSAVSPEPPPSPPPPPSQLREPPLLRLHHQCRHRPRHRRRLRLR